MKALGAKWAVMAAMAAMIGMTACNKKSEEKTGAANSGEKESFAEKVGEETRQTTRDVAEGTEKAAKKTEEEARQTGRDISEGTEKAVKKTEEEARQTTRDMSEGTDKAVKKTEEAYHDTKENVKQGTKSAEKKVEGKDKQAMSMPADKAKTQADEQINTRIRGALRGENDKEVVSASYDVRIKTSDGKVTLEGTVPSKEISQQIATTAKGVTGVTKVDNKMKVAERVGTGSGE